MIIMSCVNEGLRNSYTVIDSMLEIAAQVVHPHNLDRETHTEPKIKKNYTVYDIYKNITMKNIKRFSKYTDQSQDFT